jgi:hypothetical protein
LPRTEMSILEDVDERLAWSDGVMED